MSSKAGSVASDRPQWIDAATAVPTTIAVRPDGQQVIVAAPPFTHVCELPSGKQIHTWPYQIQAFYSGDGKSVLTVSATGAFVADTTSFQIRRTFPAHSRIPRNDWTSSFGAISGDGQRIAVTERADTDDADSSGVVRIFECSTGRETLSFLIPEKARVQSLDFLSNGTRLLVQYRGQEEAAARQLWDVDRSEVLVGFSAGAKVVVSRNRDLIAVGMLGQKVDVAIYEAGNGSLQNQFQHSDVLNEFTFRPDSKQLLIASSISRVPQSTSKQSDSASLKLPVSRITQWDLETSKVTFEETHDEHQFAGVMYDAEGGRIFGGLAKPTGVDDDLDYFLSAWDAKTSAPVKVLSEAFFVYEFGEAVFLPGSDDTIALGEPFGIRNIITGREVCPVGRYRVAQSRVQFQPDSHSIYIAGSLIDLESGRSKRSFPMGSPGQFVDEGKTFLSFQHPSLSLIDAASREEFWNLYLECSASAARATVVTSDAAYIVRSQPINSFSVAESRVLIIRPAEPNLPKILHRYASSLAIHPSDRKFATASDHSIEEFDIVTGLLTRKVGDIPGRVLDMVYSADGSQIAACGVVGYRDPQARFRTSSVGWVWLFDCETQQVRKLSGHTAVVTSLAVDPHGHRMVTSSHDGTVRLWNTESGDCLHVYRGHHREIYDVDMSSDGRLLVSAGADGIAVWNVAEVVDTDVAAPKIASKLTFDETRPNSSPATGRSNSGSPLAQKRPSPAEGRDVWDVVHVGDTSRVHFTTRSVEMWLRENRQDHREINVKKVNVPKSPVPSAFGGPSSQSSDGKRLLFTDLRDHVIKVFDSDYEEIQSWPIRASEHSAVISPDGDRVIVQREDRTNGTGKVVIDIYDVQSGDLLESIQDLDARWGTYLKIDPLGRTLMAQVDNNSLDLRDLTSTESLGRLKSVPSGAGRKAEYSPDGRLIAMSKYPNPEIVLCDPLTLKPVHAIMNDLPVRWFKFTPDGFRLLVGQPYARSRTLLSMWQIDHSENTTARLLWSKAGPVGKDGTFSDDGRRYLSPANWNMWTLWDTEQGEVSVAVITSDCNVKEQFKLSADGRSIHFYSSDGKVVWRNP